MESMQGGSGFLNEYLYVGDLRVARVANLGPIYYYYGDHLGTARLITDGGGTKCYDADYFPWGGEQHVYVNSCAQNYKFTGKERDPDTGSDYFGARWYRNTMARFYSPDPDTATPLHLINPQRWNMYAYVLNNPLTYTDSDGRDAVAVGFSDLAGGAGHIAVVSVHRDGSATYGGFGPTGGGKPVWAGHVELQNLATKIAFDGSGKPTQESLKALAHELAGIEGQDASSVSLAYYKTSPQDTAAMDSYMEYAFDHYIRAGYGIYEVTQNDCRDYARTTLGKGGVNMPFRTHGLTPNMILEILMKGAAASYSEEKKKEEVTHKIVPCGGDKQPPCQQ